MFRPLFLLLPAFLFFNVLNAQTETNPPLRLTMQDLSPAEAKLFHKTHIVEDFSRNLSSLKTAFAAKDASRIVAYEGNILRGMKNAIDQMSAEPGADTDPVTKSRLEKMNNTLAAFEAHAFDPSKSQAAAADFAKLDEFLKIIEEALADYKNSKG